MRDIRTLALKLLNALDALRAVALPLLAVFKRHAPGIRVALLRTEDDRVVHRLAPGALDPALMKPQSAVPDLHVGRLFDERYVCALRRDHPAAAGDRLSR